MSGGSWDYFCFSMNDVANRLCEQKDPLRRAFGEHMYLCAQAMHDIEWADSGDIKDEVATESIRAVFADDADRRVIDVLLSDGADLLRELKAHGVKD